MHARLATLFEHAARGHGLTDRRELAELCFSDRQIENLVRQGRLTRLGTQVFAVAGLPVTDLTRVAAACRDTGGIASHVASAWLHGLGPKTPGRPPQVLVQARGHSYRGPLAQVHTTTWLPADETVTIHGIRCLSVARTLFSLAGGPERLPPVALRKLVDDAVRTRKATDAWLWWHLERVRHRGRPGVASLERVLSDRADAPTESWLEREMLALLQRAGLPTPTCQARIGRSGAFVARVDFVYESARVVIEALGHTHHSGVDQLAADAARRNRLQLAGFRVLEFTYDDIVGRPVTVTTTIADALRCASAGAASPSAGRIPNPLISPHL